MLLYSFLSAGAYCTIPLLRYGCTFVELEFFERLYKLQRETYNANLVVETAHRDWNIHYMFQKRQVCIPNVKSDNKL